MDTTNNEIFENGYASGKMDGFREGWTLARKIMYDYSDRDLGEMFGTISHYDIFRFPVEDIRRAYEEFKCKIKVGDVVKYGRYVGVVLQKDDNGIVRILTKSSKGNDHIMVASFPVSALTKLAEGADSLFDILEKSRYINEQ